MTQGLAPGPPTQAMALAAKTLPFSVALHPPPLGLSWQYLSPLSLPVSHLPWVVNPSNLSNFTCLLTPPS